MKFLPAFAGALLGVASLVTAAPAADYPSRPVEVIVPTAAGGGTDLLTRAFADHANKVFPQALGVVNKAGGGGAVGLTQLMAARPNGYTIAMGFVEITTLPHLGLAAFKADSFQPIARLNAEPAAVTVRADSPWQSLEEFLASAKEEPGKIRVGNSGTGAIYHLAAAAFGEAAGVEFNNVPFDGANPAVTALLGGHIEAVTVSPAEVSNYVDAGQLRILAVMDDHRSTLYPDVPTLTELGYDVNVGTWRGLFAPKGTPEDVVNTLRELVRTVVEEESFQEQMKAMKMTFAYLDAPEFEEAIQRDDAFFADLVPRIGLTQN
ncbi:MAG: ABC transporter substrate-binding protein [Rhizobiaceae bacterium]|nr:ABC transporter substrate-binding protein [Rhizobiaceae bacterium]